ncbi:MAG: hypothetical protein HC877_22365 [Thioploca sp.]|nr:hypothetical protein [Thioploca sp.]
MRINKRIRVEYETLLKQVGEEKFCSHIVDSGLIAKKEYENPEIIMLDQSEAFFALFRTTGNDIYFTIAKLLRKAAHKLYRILRKKDKNHPKNKRFIQIVKI